MGLLDRLVRGASVAAPIAADPVVIMDSRDLLGPGQSRSAGAGYQRPWSANWGTPDITALVKDASEKAVTVYACCTALAKSVAEAPVKVYRLTPDTTDDDDVDTDHPVALLLARPNPRHSAYQLVYLCVKTMSLAGYVVLEKVRDKRTGQVVELWPLRPEFLKVKPRDQQEPQWEYRPNGRTRITLEPEDVIVITFDDDPASPHTGISPVKVAMRNVQLEDAADGFLKLLIESGGVPPFAIENPGPVNAQQVAEIQRTWREKYLGIGKANQLPVLHSGFKLVKTGMSLSELLFPDVRALTEIKICQAFGVPGIMVQAKTAYEHSTYSNAGEWREQFTEDTIAPLWRRIEDKLTAALLREFDEDPQVVCRFDVSRVKALQDNTDKVWERATRALQAGGMRLDDYLRITGQKQAGGDLGGAFFLPFNVVPTLADGRVVEAPATSAVRSVRAETTIVEIPAPPMALSAAAARYERRDESRLETREIQRRASAARTQQRQMKSLTDKLAPELRRFWQAQADRIVPVLIRSLYPDVETRDAAEVDWLDEERRLAEVLTRFYSLTGETAYRVAGELLSLEVKWDVGNPNVRRIIRLLGERITGIAQTTRTQIQDVIGAGTAEGRTLDQIADDIRKLLGGDSYRDRSYVIARTETKDAYGMASELAFVESGEVDTVEIHDNPAHTDRYGSPEDGLTCAERHLIVVPVTDMSMHIRSDHPNGSAFGIPIVREAA